MAHRVFVSIIKSIGHPNQINRDIVESREENKAVWELNRHSKGYYQADRIRQRLTKDAMAKGELISDEVGSDDAALCGLQLVLMKEGEKSSFWAIRDKLCISIWEQRNAQVMEKRRGQLRAISKKALCSLIRNFDTKHLIFRRLLN